ncbi:protein slit-like [Ylistrum balloti]|uniref:protein slit-like n=1 Tax=Ylistrum balloti TaxID=509963 RepID=UPI002905EDE5|nr:protein slit-like [Ylistrum balloti]
MTICGKICRCISLLIVQTHMSCCMLACYSDQQHTINNQSLTYLNVTVLDNCSAGTHTLSAKDNDIESLTEASFRISDLCKFYYLGLISLTNNNINTIGKKTFSCFPRLTKLDLSYNKLTTLVEGVFDNLIFLEVLDLSYNSIRHIDTSVFGRDRLTYLNHVYLQNNDLHEMEPWPYVLNSIRFFDIRNNSISRFSNNMGWTYDLREPFLTIVDMRYNNLTDWRDEYLLQYHPQGDVSVDLITYNMDLRDNPWKCDCYVHNIVSRFQSSFFLHIPNDPINLPCETPYQLHNELMLYVPRLNDLVCNVTMDCPEHCICQQQPENQILTVDCSGQGLKSMPQTLPPLPTNYTYVLNVSFNSITEVTWRKYTEKIQTLDLQGNGLQTIEPLAIRETPNLKFMDLKNNNLKSLPNTMQKIVFEMTNLSNNPFVCDCDMIWMGGWIKRSPVFTFGRDMKCTFNEEQYLITEVSNDLLNCSKYLAIGLAIGFGILLVVVTIVVVWAKRCPYETKVVLFKYFGFHPRDKYIVDREAETDYDVYVSFDDENIHIRQWVLMKLAAKLEPTYKMFIPIRDLPVGTDRGDETIKSLERSKRIIILLSDGYEQHGWCAFECQRAEILDFSEGRIIYIKYHDSVMEILNQDPWKTRLNDRKVFSPSGNKSDRRWFWDKLKYELPVVLQKDRKYCFYA